MPLSLYPWLYIITKPRRPNTQNALPSVTWWWATIAAFQWTRHSLKLLSIGLSHHYTLVGSFWQMEEFEMPPKICLLVLKNMKCSQHFTNRPNHGLHIWKAGWPFEMISQRPRKKTLSTFRQAGMHDALMAIKGRESGWGFFFHEFAAGISMMVPLRIFIVFVILLYHYLL